MADTTNAPAERIHHRPGAHYALGAAATALFYPFGYGKVLIQIGHEPLAPVLTKTIFGRNRLVYPNIFKYLGHVRSVDGVSGLYRGLVPRLISGIIGSSVQSKVNELYMTYLTPENDQESGQGDHPVDEEAAPKSDDVLKIFQDISKEISRECVARCAGIVISQPFHVLMLRSMAQFVGGEDKYSGLLSGIKEIFHNDGILGFFSGLVPRLIGEMLMVSLGSSLAYVINYYFVEDKDMKGYTHAACYLTYPFLLVSNITAVSGSGLLACSPPHMPSYTGWVDCWQHLSKTGQLKRGANLFWRFYNGPTLMRGGQLAPDNRHHDDFHHFRLHSS